MKILISPAKSLDTETRLPTARGTQARFLDTTFKINKKLKRTSRKELAKLMNISDKLADLNYHRNQEFEEKHTQSNSRPAMYLYNGDVYDGLEAYSLPSEKLDDAQEKIRIISGLYGVLRPLDLIQAYRLEMGVKFSVGRNKNLYDLWREKITASLKSELQDGELLVNLASNEYAKAIDFKSIDNPMVSPVFKDFKNGKLKVISFFAKKARGAMTRFLIDKDAESFDDLKKFTWEGYQFDQNETKKDNDPVFTR